MPQRPLTPDAVWRSRSRSRFAWATVATLLIAIGWGAVLYIERTTRADDEIRALRARLDAMSFTLAHTRAERDIARFHAAGQPYPIYASADQPLYLSLTTDTADK